MPADPDQGIQLRVLWPNDFDRDGQWAVGGVPFSRGELDPADDVAVVTPDGDVRPVQTRVLAYWPDDSVKWLLVVTTADVVADADAELRLVREPDSVPELAGTDRIAVERSDDAVEVDTGPMQFRVPLDGAALFDSVTVDGDSLVTAANPPELFVDVGEKAADGADPTRYSDHHGATFRSVEVEETGPYRATVAITGTHVASDGSTFAPYTVRLSAFAGETDLRVAHTFVFDGDPDEEVVDSLGLRVPVDAGGARNFAYGGSRPPVTRSPADRREDWKMSWRYGDLYQETPTSYRFDKRVEPDKPPVAVEHGERSDGWLDLDADGRGVAVTVKDAWQNAPTAIRADAEDGVVTAFLWPDRHDALDLEWYSDTAYGHIYEAPGTPPRQNSPRVPTMNAHGISKTHDLMLSFHADSVADEDLAARAGAFDDPPLVSVPPERYAETKVLGSFAVDPPEGLGEQGGWIEEGLDYILQEQDFRGWYGMLDYGDVVRAYDADLDQWTSDRGGHGWLNTEFQPDQWLWFGFLQTGRYDVFRYAEAMARHTTDVDVLHAGPWWGFGARHGVQHWSDGDREIRVSMPGGRRLHYYLTGDERTRDVIELAVRRYRTMQREPGRTWMGFGSEMYTRTDVTTALYAYFVAWEMTGDDEYETLVRNLLTNVFCDTHPSGAPYNRARVDLSTGEGEPVRDGPVISSNMFLQFGGIQLLVELAELDELPEARDLVLDYADYQLLPYEERKATGDNAGRGLGHRVRAMPLHAFAYRETGDEDHRTMIEEGFADREVSFGPASWDDDLLAIVDQERPVDSPISSLAAFGRKAPYGFAALADEQKTDD